MKKYFILVLWRALEVSYKSFYGGEEIALTPYTHTHNIHIALDIFTCVHLEIPRPSLISIPRALNFYERKICPKISPTRGTVKREIGWLCTRWKRTERGVPHDRFARDIYCRSRVVHAGGAYTHPRYREKKKAGTLVLLGALHTGLSRARFSNTHATTFHSRNFFLFFFFHRLATILEYCNFVQRIERDLYILIGVYCK